MSKQPINGLIFKTSVYPLMNKNNSVIGCYEGLLM